MEQISKKFDAKKFSGQTPLFPLPDTVLLPGQEIRLHVFEMRYRAMTQTALSGDALLGLAFLKPGWKDHYYESPAVHPVICVASIRSVERLDDGRFNLVLSGQSRARLLKEVRQFPYRVARIRLLEDKDLPARKAAAEHRWLIHWIDERLPDTTSLKDLLKKRWAKAPLGKLIDAVTASLQVEASLKYEFLRETDVLKRMHRLRPLLKKMRLTSTVWKKPHEPGV